MFFKLHKIKVFLSKKINYFYNPDRAKYEFHNCLYEIYYHSDWDHFARHNISYHNFGFGVMFEPADYKKEAKHLYFQIPVPPLFSLILK
jgi:hypothetical protein